MIHCRQCRRLTEGLDGRCSLCFVEAGDDLRRFLREELERGENRLNMAFVQWQVDQKNVALKEYILGSGEPGEHEAAEFDAYVLGQKSRVASLPVKSNPYPSADPRSSAWLRGWYYPRGTASPELASEPERPRLTDEQLAAVKQYGRHGLDGISGDDVEGALIQEVEERRAAESKPWIWIGSPGPPVFRVVPTSLESRIEALCGLAGKRFYGITRHGKTWAVQLVEEEGHIAIGATGSTPREAVEAEIERLGKEGKGK